MRLAQLWRRRRRLKVTREGKYFIIITLGIGLAALNTGNNLLFLLLGWMCSVIVASGVLSEHSLRGLTVARQPPARIHAGRPFLMGISLKNSKTRLPSLSIEIEDLVLAEPDAPKKSPRPLDKKCYFLKIPSGRTQSTSYRHTFARRGLYRFTGFRVSTKFPFALFRKSRDVDCPGEIIVYPAIYPVNPPAPAGPLGGEEARARAGRRGEFHGLREMRQGDDIRDVHWRSSAKAAAGDPAGTRLLVREYEEESQRRATLFLDNALADGAPADAADGLERAISMAASLAQSYLLRQYAVRLVCRGTHVPFQAGPAQLTRVLRALALLPTVTPGTAWSAAADPRTENVLVVARGAATRERPAGVARVVEAG